MPTPNNRVEVPAEVREQLREELAEEQIRVPVPPRFEMPEGEPEPWSVPPPGGFAELRAQLFHKRAS